jgi:hypothetical protein
MADGNHLLHVYICPMPRRELRYPHQVVQWLDEWGGKLSEEGELILIGSAGLLWHAARLCHDDPLPENSMDVDPVTDSDAVAELAYDAMIGSEFEASHGWHVNLMPRMALREMPDGWLARAEIKHYGMLKVVVPSAKDLLAPKLARGEPRDLQHEAYATAMGLV